MNLQLNPIASGYNSFLQPWSKEGSRPSPTQDVFSQGYPPNVSASVVTINLPPSNVELVSEPAELRLVLSDKIEFLADNFDFFQIPFVHKKARIKTATIRPSDVIVHDMDELMAGKEDEVKPTAFAYTYARHVIESAYGKAKITGSVPTVLPKPLATTDDLGGVRLIWNLGTRNVRLNFGAAEDRQSYLYYEAGQDHGVEPLDEDHLAGRLAWLTAR